MVTTVKKVRVKRKKYRYKKYRKSRTLKYGSVGRAILTAGYPGRNVIGGLAGLLPQKLLGKFKYTDYAVISTGAGTNFYELIFKANSLFDPHLSGGTRNGQPLFYDQLSALYRRYRVNGCKIDVSFISSSSSASTGGVQMIVHANSIATADTVTYADDPNTLMEQNNTIAKVCSALGTGPQPLRMKMYRNRKTMFPLTFNDSNQSAAVTADPSTLWYYHVSLFDLAHDTVGGSVNCIVNVKLTMYCEMSRIDDTAAS